MKLTHPGPQDIETTGVSPSDLAFELNRNAHMTSGIRHKVREGKGWEGALVGAMKQAFEVGKHSGKPSWQICKFTAASTCFEFDSFDEWIRDPNGLGLHDPMHLIQLLEISPDPEGPPLADRVREELKLGPGRPPKETANNVRSFHAGQVQKQEAGNTSAGVRRKIRNWVKANPDHPNHALAVEWIDKLEANPRCRLHQQALREIGIATIQPKRTLDVSNVPDHLIRELHEVAVAEATTIAEVLEDALAIYFRQLQEPEAEPAVEPIAEPSSPPQAVVITPDLPPAGLYPIGEAAKALGIDPTALSQAKGRANGSNRILRRKFANLPFEVWVHPTNKRSQLIEIKHLTGANK